MFKFISATIVMFALTATGLAQDAKKEKKPEPIVPEGEKILIAEAAVKGLKLNGITQTLRGPRLDFTLNGNAYRVLELKVKSEGELIEFVVGDGHILAHGRSSTIRRFLR